MKPRLLVFCLVLVIAIVALLTISCGQSGRSEIANTSVSQPIAAPSLVNTQDKSSVLTPDESNSDKTRQSTWKPPRSGVLTGIIVDEQLGPRWRAIIVETKGTRFRIPVDIARSAGQSDREYLLLLREYPSKVIGELKIGEEVRVTYKKCYRDGWTSVDWSLEATKIVEIRNRKTEK